MKSIFIFCGGLIVGAVGGFVAAKVHLEKKYASEYDRQIADMEEYYGTKDRYIRGYREEVNNDKDKQGREAGPMTADERKEIKDKLYKKPKKTDYTKYYDKDEDADPAEEEHPEDDPPDPEYEAAEMAFDEHRKNMNKLPRIISAEAYSNLPAYINQTCLYFFAYDEMLCDENEEPIEEPEVLVGDALTKYDFVDNDERVIYVMNYALDTCYEICKLDQAWTDTH